MEKYFISLFVIFSILSSGHQVKAENECSSNPCLNGATCVDDGNYGYYTCQCTTNWMGANCEIAAEGANCGTNHYSSTGTITSLNYPSLYHNNDHCLYLIRVHGANAITLDFTDFQLIDLDSLLIGTGPIPGSSSRVNTLFGYYNWRQTYTSNEIWMEFITDYIDRGTGWSCTYTAVLSDCPCLNGGSCIDGTKQCSCVAGWEGERCEMGVNECTSMPCLNGGTCHDDTDQYECTCDPAWYGIHCEIKKTKCLSNQCLNGGTCYIYGFGFECKCQPGYSGELCETAINVCCSQPCLNGGTLNDDINLYTCDCLPGWRGDNCGIDINECSSEPCLNNGTCNNDINLYTCDCLPGWTGDSCEIDTNECSSQPCLNGATCNDDINLYTCDCLPGWTGDNCETEIDECASSPCQNGGTCYDLTNQYVCICVSGWHGDTCNDDFQESSADDGAVYPVTIALTVIIVMMIIGFIIFYKFCYLKNTGKGHDTERSGVQYAVPKGTVAISTANTYENPVLKM